MNQVDIGLKSNVYTKNTFLFLILNKIAYKHFFFFSRIWWIISFSISLIGCGILIQNIYDKWDESPVIVSFNEKSTPVWEIPFPAVTICPETKANISMLNFTNNYHHMMTLMKPPYNISESEMSLMQAVAHICDAHTTDSFDLNQNFTDNSIVDKIKKVSVTHNQSKSKSKFPLKLICLRLHQHLTKQCFSANGVQHLVIAMSFFTKL